MIRSYWTVFISRSTASAGPRRPCRAGLRPQVSISGLDRNQGHYSTKTTSFQGISEASSVHSNRSAVVVYNGTAYAYVKNLQGDIIAILDQSGNVVVQYAYDAWGRPISCSGSMASTLGVINPFRYRGYVYDQETGVFYLHNRYYTPMHCRFVNAYVLIEENTYAYCKNNPCMYCDHTGCKPTTTLLHTISSSSSQPRPTVFDINSTVAPRYLNPANVFGWIVDAELPLIEERRYEVSIDLETGSKVQSKYVTGQVFQMIAEGVFVLLCGYITPKVLSGVFLTEKGTSIATGIYAAYSVYQSGKDAYSAFNGVYFAPDKYTITIGIYDTSIVAENLKYVIYRIDCGNNPCVSSFCCDWCFTSAAYDTSDTTYDEIIKRAFNYQTITEVLFMENCKHFINVKVGFSGKVLYTEQRCKNCGTMCTVDPDSLSTIEAYAPLWWTLSGGVGLVLSGIATIAMYKATESILCVITTLFVLPMASIMLSFFTVHQCKKYYVAHKLRIVSTKYFLEHCCNNR